MKTYSVKKRFGKKYTINGVDYFYEVQPNQVIQGTPTADGTMVRMSIRLANNRPYGFFIPITNLNQIITESAQSSIDGTDTGASENTKTSIFTTRNIVMGIVGIALVYGLLKVTKVIK
jgi:hypothetical protein